MRKQNSTTSCRRNWHTFAATAIAILIVHLSCISDAHSAPGDILATFPFQASRFVNDPNQPLMYATNGVGNTIEAINTQTLSITKSINLPGSPSGLAIGPDGTLYVSDSTNSSVDVINTQTLSLTRSIPVLTTPYDVAVGLNNRLYVLDQPPNPGPATIKQVDAISGLAAGPDFPYPYATDPGWLLMSPDRRTLYYAEDRSSATVKAFDVSTTTPHLLRHVDTGNGNAGAPSLSHSGDLYFEASIGGAIGYTDTLFRSSDFSALATFNLGAYPTACTFSPDDKLLYVVQSSGIQPAQLKIFSTSTYSQVGQLSLASDSIVPIITDPTGRELFASVTGLYSGTPETIVYDTGHQVPEPTTCALLGSALLVMVGIQSLRCLAKRRSS